MSVPWSFVLGIGSGILFYLNKWEYNYQYTFKLGGGWGWTASKLREAGAD